MQNSKISFSCGVALAVISLGACEPINNQEDVFCWVENNRIVLDADRWAERDKWGERPNNIYCTPVTPVLKPQVLNDRNGSDRTGSSASERRAPAPSSGSVASSGGGASASSGGSVASSGGGASAASGGSVASSGGGASAASGGSAASSGGGGASAASGGSAASSGGGGAAASTGGASASAGGGSSSASLQ